MANDKLVLDLKNIKPAQFVNTQYNNSTSIDNVVIQALPGDRIKIFLNGANIASSKVILDTRNEALSRFLQLCLRFSIEAPKSCR